MANPFAPTYAKPDEIDCSSRFDSKKTLEEYLCNHGEQIDTYNHNELYIIARNKGAHHEACQKWNKEIECYWHIPTIE